MTMAPKLQCSRSTSTASNQLRRVVMVIIDSKSQVGTDLVLNGALCVLRQNDSSCAILMSTLVP
jgi:hypothetical protein